MNYTVYDNSTGEILELVSISNLDMLDIIMEDRSYIEGHYSPTEYYIDQGQVCEKPSQPLHEYIQYSFDWTTKSWNIDIEKTADSARQIRNNLLSAVDRINPIWYNSLTTEQQQELVDYRQQLLDVPEQSGFPTDTVWPAKPTWL